MYKPQQKCGDCHFQPATWFSHAPDYCEDDDCDCEPQCNDCLKYHLHLIKWVYLIRCTAIPNG